MPAHFGRLTFKQLDPRATLPTRGSALAAGLDIYAIEELTIAPGERQLARTGLVVAIPEGYYGRIAPRSGLALKNGLDVLAGVIDADYRGELGVFCSTTPEARLSICRRKARCAS